MSKYTDRLVEAGNMSEDYSIIGSTTIYGKDGEVFLKRFWANFIGRQIISISRYNWESRRSHSDNLE
jgi:hypothetical protein